MPEQTRPSPSWDRAGRDAVDIKSYNLLSPPTDDCHELGYKFVKTQENRTPDFEFCDLAVTTAPADAGNRHRNQASQRVVPIADMHRVLREKTKFCAFVFSNPVCATRNRFLEILARHQRIDSAGALLANQPKVAYPISRVIEFYRPYKFVLAFENSLSLHYASEKLGTALMGDTVPVYWGNPQIVSYFNPERFINAFDFDNLESLAAHVMRVHADDALYLRYLSAPSGTPRQEHPRFAPKKNSALARRLRQQFSHNRARLLNQRTLPLAQRRMFHREALSRFAPVECAKLVKDRLLLTGWPAIPIRQHRGFPVEDRLTSAGWPANVILAGRHHISRCHIWPHSAFYQVVDMDGRLEVQD